MITGTKLSKVFDLLRNVDSLPFVHLKTDGDRLQLIRDSEDCYAIASIEYEGEPLNHTIDYSVTREYLARENRWLDIVPQGDRLCFKTDSSRYAFTLIEHEMQPIETGEYLGEVLIDTYALKDALVVASASASQRDFGFNQHKIKLEMKGGTLGIQATNGSLAISRNIETDANINGAWVVSKSIVKLIAKIESAQTAIAFHEKHLCIKAEGIEFIYRTESTFPDYVPLLRHDKYDMFQCAASALNKAISRIKCEDPSVLVTADYSTQSLLVQSSSAQVEIKAKVYVSQTIEIGLSVFETSLKKLGHTPIAIGMTTDPAAQFIGTTLFITLPDGFAILALYDDREAPINSQKYSCSPIDVSMNSLISCVHEMKNVSEQTTTQDTDMNANSFNYFAELAQAREAGAWTEKRNPKKDELIEAISAHAKAIEVKPLEATVTIPNSVSYASLHEQWKAKKEGNTPDKVKTYPAKAQKNNPSTQISALINLLQSGATEEQICREFGWKSWTPTKTVVRNYGYSVTVDNGIYAIAQ
jgi:hypothetical protein